MRLAAAYMSSIVLEAVAEAEGDGLLAQVGQLAAGDLVEVDPAGGGRQARLEGRVELAHRLPVGLERRRPLSRSRPVARSVSSVAATRADSDGWLRGAGHRRAGGVDRVDAGVDGGEEGGELAARGVVRVQVHRQVEALAQRRDEAWRPRVPAAARPCP